MPYINDRVIICSLDHPFTTDPSKGLVKALFEKIDGHYVAINPNYEFCSTGMVFITRGYDDLEEKYAGQLFELKCSLSKFEIKDGDCKYVSHFDLASPIRSKYAVQEVFKSNVPDVNSPSISSTTKPITSHIFVEDEQELIGPYEIIEVIDGKNGLYQIELKTSEIETPSADKSNLPPFNVAKVLLEDIKDEHLNFTKDGKEFIGDVQLLISKRNETLDFISDNQIIKLYSTPIAKGGNIRNFTKGMVDLIQKQVSTAKDYRKNNERYKRFLSLLQMPLEWQEGRGTLFSEFLSTSEGKETLTNYIDSQRDQFFEKEKQNFQSKLVEESEELKKELNNLALLKKGIEDDIRELRSNKQQQAEEEVDKTAQLTATQKQKIEENLKSLSDKLNLKEVELIQLEEKYKEYKSLDDLNQEVEYQTRTIEKLKTQKVSIEQATEKAKEKLKEENEALAVKLASIKPDIDALTGLTHISDSQNVDYNSPSILSEGVITTTTQVEYIEEIGRYLKAYGREIEFNELTNILVTISQSQFTLFSGLPGTGKTSLAKLLGNAIGLGNRFLNIPVARGWTSTKDVLGFYNPLSQSFVKASTDLYSLLLAMQDETDGKLNSTAIVLLDEFNLSQPEHYFSPFMEMADVESSRVLVTGNPSEPELKIPNHLRFLGTINNDESIQSLTPRMIDRAAIINFDDFNQDLFEFESISKKVQSNTTPISGDRFFELFEPNHAAELPDYSRLTLRSIIDILHDSNPELGTKVIVSYRKLKSIKDYHSVASNILIEPLEALDFAVCQHIFPLINGYGEAFGERLKQLKECLPSDMQRSHEQLQRIIVNGEMNMFTYGAL